MKIGITTILASLAIMAPGALAQTTAFTYQGELKDNGQLANGAYDITIVAFDAATGGNPVGSRCLNDRPVVNGRFSAEVDFGTLVQGAPYYLEIRARRHTTGVNCGSGDGFTTLTPR